MIQCRVRLQRLRIMKENSNCKREFYTCGEEKQIMLLEGDAAADSSDTDGIL